MNRQKWILLVVTVGLTVLAGAAIFHVKTHQVLGQPGIKAAPIPGRVDMAIDLPAQLAGYISTNLPQSAETTNMLPKDTSFALRVYWSESKDFWAQANIVMMGKDRTSIHKPEYCLPGHGLTINLKTNDVIAIKDPASAYGLPVAKWFLTRTGRTESGQTFTHSAIYVFWFVARDEQTIDHWQRIWWLSRDLLTKGVLQRWAYVSYYTECIPGQEEAAYHRLSQLIAASVPEFQHPPAAAAAVARR
ncbi:MAG: exosortase-associated EpsI family protein [Verrucomicrobiota bacterium]